MSLMQELNDKALGLGVPLSAHLDITYRCNERCEHCYLDHEDHGEMTTAEIKDVLRQLADAGVFFLTLSGGEVLMRRDCFEIIEYARSLMFNVKLKTNAVHDPRKRSGPAARPGRGTDSDQRVLAPARSARRDHQGSRLTEANVGRDSIAQVAGMRVNMANVLMRGNRADAAGVHALAKELGAHYTLDPTITPMMDGDTSVLQPAGGFERASRRYFHNPELVGDVESFCAPPAPVNEDVLEGLPCSAGTHFVLHLALRRRLPLRAISDYVRQRAAAEISRHLAGLAATQRGPLDPPEAPHHVLLLHARRQLHALPGPCLHGREYAWPFVGGLREVFCANGNRYRRNDGEGRAIGGRSGLVQIEL